MSQSLTKKEAQQQQVQGQKQYAKDTVTEEKHASANASVRACLLTFTIHDLLQAVQSHCSSSAFAYRICGTLPYNPPSCVQISTPTLQLLFHQLISNFHYQHRANASQAGLNLNLFGAVSGALSSKSKKSTHQNPDGSSDTVEDRAEQGEPHSQYHVAHPTRVLYSVLRNASHFILLLPDPYRTLCVTCTLHFLPPV
jgi:hypothetical protein